MMKIRKAVTVAVCSVLLLFSVGCNDAPRAQIYELGEQPYVVERSRPRTVITTDGEADDMNSFIRALLYANDMRIEGIVLTSSIFHWAGFPDAEEGKSYSSPYRWTGETWINEYIDGYEEVYGNLKAHDPNYPTPEYLRSIFHVGNIYAPGDMSVETDGSNFLKELFLDDNDEPLYVQTWGGVNTTARALKSVEDEYSSSAEWESIKKKICDKVVLYLIAAQDNTYRNYLMSKWPELTVIKDEGNFDRFAYTWKKNSAADNVTLNADWQKKYILNEDNPLLKHYYSAGDGKTLAGEQDESQWGWDSYMHEHPEYKKYDFVSEGDSPSFLFLIDNGLRSMENYAYGGWGGRFLRDGKNARLWNNTAKDRDPDSGKKSTEYTLTRWITDFNYDFAARIAWTQSEKGNHAPNVVIREGLNIEVPANSEIRLNAIGSDVDDDAIEYLWWRYDDADTLNKDVALAQDGAQVTLTIPSDAQTGETIHMICEVKDKGSIPLKSYARVIITIK